MPKIIVFFLLSLILVSTASAQGTIVRGVIVDKKTKETLPTATVIFQGSVVGCVSDNDGKFELSSPKSYSAITVSMLGYTPQTLPIKSLRTNQLNIEMESESINLEEVVIKPSENPAHVILRAIDKNKYRNNSDKYRAYNYQKYTKWEYALVNLPAKLKNTPYFKPWKNVFKLQSDSINYYLPIYFSEKISNNEFQSDPLLKRRTIIAEKQSSLKFLDDLQVSGYTSSLNAGYNFYNNYINLYDKNFVSPLNSSGLFFYKYYITDSTEVAGVKHYTIEYMPKNPMDNVFYGTFEVETKYYSIVKLNARMSPDANLNFMRNLKFKVGYQLYQDSIPFFSRNEMSVVIDYYPGNDTTGTRMSLSMDLVNTYDSVSINPKGPIRMSSHGVSYETIQSEGYKKHDEIYWERHRQEPLSLKNIESYQVIDTINNIPLVKQLDLLAQMSLTGYYSLGKYELGPYLNVFTYNQIEGYRVFFGGRTGEEISDTYQAWGGLAYGFKDRKFKGNLGIGHKFKTPQRKIIQMYFSDDIIRIGGSDRILNLYENKLTPSEDNLISALLNRTKVDQLMQARRLDLSFENEWHSGFSSTAKLSLQSQDSPLYYPFMQRGKAINRIEGAELSIDNRFSSREAVIEKGMRRLYITSKYPIVHFMVGLGYTKVGEETHLYTRLHTTIKQHVFFGQTVFDYAIEAGTILGVAPYTFLEIPRGNQNYGYYHYNFNLMDNLTYVNDLYAHVYTEYHLNGFLLNRVPLFKHLRCRELITAKAMMGSRRANQNEYLAMPNSVIDMDGRPYVELGAGLENIFKFFRLDCIWRVLPNGVLTSSQRMGIRGTFSIDF